MAETTGVIDNATVMQDVVADGFSSPGDRKQLIDSPDGDSFEGSGHEVSPLHLESHSSPSDQSAKKSSEGLKIIVVSSIVFAVAVTVALILTIFLAPPQVKPHGAVATDNEECSKIGTDILKKGGSAVDAAIAATLCMGVVHPDHVGIGGGGFMLVRQHKKKKTTAFNFRETAPASAKADMLDNYDPKDDNERGKVVGVPGMLRGLEAAHREFGKLKWDKLVEPAIDLAKNGFVVSGHMAEIMDRGYFNFGDIEALDVVFFPDGQAATAGSTTTWPAMAAILETVQKDGAEAIYSGNLAKEISAAVMDQGGILSLSDLNEYKVLPDVPLVSTFLDMSVETMPPPAAGSVLILLLNIMEGYYKKKEKHTKKDNSTATPHDPYLNIHRFLEATKFAYAHDSLLGDITNKSDDVIRDEIIRNSTEHLLDKDYAEKLRAMIEDDKTHPNDPDYYGQGLHSIETGGTSHISVIGPNEDHVAVTITMNHYFGSKIATPSGIILNDEMLDFETNSSKTDSLNLIEGRKRPVSHMVPTIVHSQDRPCGLRIPIGGANASRIVAGVAEVILNIFGEYMSLEDAIENPRLFAYFNEQGEDVIEYDMDLNETLVEYLKHKGHPVPFILDDMGLSIINAVAKMNETVKGHSDSRGYGQASVY